MKVKFLGTYNAESKYTRLVSILIDGIIAVDAGSLTSELSFPEQEKIKAILLSHGHYDHIKCVPAFAFNNACQTTQVYALQDTLEILASHLVDGLIYPKFTKITPVCEEQSLEFVALEPFIPFNIQGYTVLPLPVNHNNISAVGFEITSKDGKRLFYTGDTGAGLSNIWEHVSSKFIIIDLTFPNRLEKTAENSAHLCPKMLKKELIAFNRIKGFYPKLYLIHLTPKFKDEIKKEINEIAKELDISIDIAREGDEIII